MPLNAMTKKDVLDLVQKHNVKFIRLWFTDILGVLKSFSITPEELPDALEEGMGFDGSSIEGYRDIEESDMIAKPDPKTFQIMPWKYNDATVGVMFCDVITPEGEPYEGDPRFVLKKVLEKAKKMGYTFYVGPELEYFYFKTPESTELIDKGGYFDLTPLDLASGLRKETIFALESMGIKVEYSHHEVAPSQHEIDLRYCEALKMADSAQAYRLIVKEVAQRHGIHATFMPKPLFGENGSGMHVHQSLFKGDKNAFFDAADKHHLSKTAKSYIAGILKYAPEFSAVTSQWVNSYKRLVPGYEAPVYIAWARSNRSALVRVPHYKPGKEKATRVEVRSPDPAGNPYLQFAVMLAAGLKGIEENLELTEPVEKNIFKLSLEDFKKYKITMLPGTLGEAIELMAKSFLMKETLGNHVFNRFVEIKRREWDEYRIQITPWEMERYLPIL